MSGPRPAGQIPVTEATPLNGCMYVVPRMFDPGDIEAVDVRNVRALPAEPGAVMGWNQDIWHWGGRSSTRAREPRISVSLEMQRGDVPAEYPNLIASDAVLELAERLAVIGEVIARYEHMAPSPPPMLALAKALSS